MSMVKIMEHFIKMDDLGGTPIFGNMGWNKLPGMYESL